MLRSFNKRIALLVLALTVAMALLLTPPLPTNAADHGDAPGASDDRTADLDDAYLFLDPNDNTKVIMGWTWLGFINPGEAGNFGTFDPEVEFVAQMETTGDTKIDQSFNVRFEPRPGPSAQQDVTITLPSGKIFKAKTTAPTISKTAPTAVVTTDPGTGIQFFAGLSDDPFYFDIPGFNRYRKSVTDGSPNPDFLKRGRDTFAGFNVLSLMFSIPRSFLNLPGNEIGLQVLSRRQNRKIFKNGKFIVKGDFHQIDRNGTPAINTVLIPFARKDEFNFSNPTDDANGKFGNDIIAALKALKTDDTSINILAGIVVKRGDLLRLKMDIPNKGSQGGNNPEAGFPNGRRVGDDVIDTLLSLINNRVPLGDNVNGNDVPYRDVFPFYGMPHQPLDPGETSTNQN